jgi:hypothetical protein
MSFAGRDPLPHLGMRKANLDFAQYEGIFARELYQYRGLTINLTPVKIVEYSNAG